MSYIIFVEDMDKVCSPLSVTNTPGWTQQVLHREDVIIVKRPAGQTLVEKGQLSCQCSPHYRLGKTLLKNMTYIRKCHSLCI